MERAEKIERVKEDLRRLNKLSHSIEVSFTVKERHEKRREFLLQGEQSAETVAEISKIDLVLSSLHLQEYIKEANALEERYMGAISCLEPLDKTIILDGYVNGKAYWKIGQDIGYSVSGIKKRIQKITEKIADQM